MTISHGENMQSYYIKPKSFYDSFGDVQPSQPYSYAYGDRPVFEFSFLPGEIAVGDTLVFAVDNDMVFYDATPENILHSASCMVVVRHDVTAEEATAGKVQLRIETRTLKFRDVVNGKVRPVEVMSGLYRRRGVGDDVSYVLLARGRAFANGIIADYDALPEPITADEYYTKADIDGLLDVKADGATLAAHTDNSDIHVTLQDKTTWDSKADIGDIGNATVTITQDGKTRGSFSVNATDSVTIDLTGGAQADWNETDTTSPSYIRNRPQFIQNYFTVTAKQADSTVRMMTMQNVIPDIEYSTDGGTTWTQLVFTKSELNESLYFSQTITMANKAKAMFRGNNHTIGNGWTGISRFLFTGQVAVSGKLMSLLDKSCASDTVPNDVIGGVFASLFSCANWSDVTFDDNMYALVDASGLVFPINSYDNAYIKMFANCKGLTNVPNCFFQGANVSQGLRQMFENSGIAGKVMLGLTGQLAASVYSGTFTGCTGITKAEILDCIPASNSFLDTFEGCTNLTEITVHFTEWNDSWQWSDAPATGVWRCPKALDITKRGMFGIPNGWTVEYIDEQNASSDRTQADWNEADTTSPAYIQNRPDLTTKLDAPAVAGTVGQVLTKTADGQEWADAPDELPASTTQDDGKVLTVNVSGEPEWKEPAPTVPDDTDYLRFTAASSNTIIKLKPSENPSYAHVNLEYSTDKLNWTTYTWADSIPFEGTSILLSNIGDSVWFRGDNNTISNGSVYYQFTINSEIYVSGNIMSMLSKNCSKTFIPAWCFRYIFKDSRILTSPDMPVVQVDGRSCEHMFENCTLLKMPPKLPATIISDDCYSNMFNGCTALLEAPELPATKLYTNCYDKMFNGCTSLRKAYALPAKSLPPRAYQYMFGSCSSLTVAPEIYATSANYNYACFCMFYKCANLEIVPLLNASNIDYSAYRSMFVECTKLKYIHTNQTTFDGCESWLKSVSAVGVFDCKSTLDTSTRGISTVPESWIVTHGANEPDSDTTSVVEAMTTDIYTVCPSSKETGVITVSSALTLNAYPASSTDIAYAEIVLDVTSGATVTAGTNLTFVDTPTAGKRNICVVRWSNGVAKLYVTIVEDLPA